MSGIQAAFTARVLTRPTKAGAPMVRLFVAIDGQGESTASV
jgi:hypothetical protein